MQGLAGRVVAITAERRSSEQADLLRSRGATVIEAPTMHTVDLTTDEELRAATDAVIEQPPGVLVATTGYGMRVWFDAAGAWGRRDELIAALSSFSPSRRIAPIKPSSMEIALLGVPQAFPRSCYDYLGASLTIIS